MQALVLKITDKLQGDRRLWALYALFALGSMLAVYSASGSLAYTRGGTTEWYMFKQLGFLIIGFGIVYGCHKVHFMRYAKFAPYLFAIVIPLLLYTLLFGESINEARRWIHLPGGISFQTSDLAELALIMFVARGLSLKQNTIKDWRVFASLILPIIAVCMLIMPANFSTAALLFAACFGMLIIGRINMKYVLYTFALFIVAIGIMLFAAKFWGEFTRAGTWLSRISEFMSDSNGGYQVQQSKMAISEGSWLGAGPGNSIQRNFLPYAYADFIYAIIIEEYGLFGGLFVMFLYIYLFVRVIRIVTLSQKTFGAMLAVGLGLHLTIQALANMAVSVNLVPVTGLTLPFISMGGTSLFFSCAALGIILSVSRNAAQKKKELAEQPQALVVQDEPTA